MKQFFFYLVDAPTYGSLDKSHILVLEQQPYGADSDKRYRIASSQEIQGLEPIQDYGRTSGWFQCLGGSGIFIKGKIKLPNHIKQIIEKTSKNLFLSVEGNTWTEILHTLGDKISP